MPARAQQHVPSAAIKIDGQELDAQYMNHLKEVVVKEAIGLPATAQVVFSDPAVELVDDPRLALGRSLQVCTGALASNTPTPIFDGVIVALEPQFASGAVEMIVRAYDKAQRLTRGTKTRTFLQMTAADAVRKIVNENALTAGTIDATTATYDYLVQADESDWDFIERLARQHDREFFVRDGKLNFREVRSAGAPPVELEFGRDLLGFAPRASYAQQVEAVEVRGYDAADFAPAIAEERVADMSSAVGLRFESITAAANSDGGARTVVIDAHPGRRENLTPLAEAIAARVAESAIEAEGAAYGDPKLRVGTRIKTKGVGQRFGGEYTLSAVTHSYRGGGGGYRTRFAVSGRSQRTLRSLIGDGGRSRPGFTSGLVVGIVTNTKDPDKRGRVKVKFPTLGGSGAEQESDWARVATLNAGNGRGIMFLPEVNDEVVVGFEHGDMRRPYVLGSVFNGVSTPSPDLYKGDGRTDFDTFLRIDTPRGFFMHTEEPMELKSDKKYTLEAGEEITIKSTGKAILISSGGGQKIEIKAGGDVSVEAQQGVTIKGNSKVDLQAQGQVNVQASGPVSVKGAIVNLG